MMSSQIEDPNVICQKAGDLNMVCDQTCDPDMVGSKTDTFAMNSQNITMIIKSIWVPEKRLSLAGLPNQSII